MKKSFLGIAVIILCFITACKDSATSGTAENTSQNEKNLAANRKVYKAIETGDKSMMDSLIANDAIDHQGANGTEIKGKDSIEHMLTEMHSQIKDLKLDIIADAANGDYIFTLVRITGTANDASMGIPAGTKMDEKGVDVVKVKDGQMVEHWGFVDPNEMMKHMQEMPVNGKMDNKMAGKSGSKMADTAKKK